MIWWLFVRLLVLLFLLVAIFYPFWGDGIFGLPFPWKKQIGWNYWFEVRPIFVHQYILIAVDVIFWIVTFYFLLKRRKQSR